MSKFNYSFIGLLVYTGITTLYILSHLSDDHLYETKMYAKMGGFPFDASFGGRLKFLTHIDVGIQTLYFGLVAVNCLFGGFICKFLFSSCCKKNESKKCGCHFYDSLINSFFVSIVFPIGAFVTISFWGLYFIDKKLVYPDPLGSIIPDWQNHVMHTLPLIGVLIESMFVEHKYPSLFRGLSLTILFVASYLTWVIYIGNTSGKWVYPILKVLTPLKRTVFLATQTFFVCFLYRVGQTLNGFFFSKSQSAPAAVVASKQKETRSKAKKAN